MPIAISNTSPILYLFRIGALYFYESLFDAVWVTPGVAHELETGLHRGYEVPVIAEKLWVRIVPPQSSPPSWFALDLGLGERETIALALEHPEHVVVLDDALARRIAQAAGLSVWGTLKVLLEAKTRGLIASVAPLVDAMQEAGMWISDDVRRRVLRLAGEEHRLCYENRSRQ